MATPSGPGTRSGPGPLFESTCTVMPASSIDFSRRSPMSGRSSSGFRPFAGAFLGRKPRRLIAPESIRRTRAGTVKCSSSATTRIAISPLACLPHSASAISRAVRRRARPRRCGPRDFAATLSVLRARQRILVAELSEDEKQSLDDALSTLDDLYEAQNLTAVFTRLARGRRRGGFFRTCAVPVPPPQVPAE
jgi:hypothetical protein